jgi:hypothetical protein
LGVDDDDIEEEIAAASGAAVAVEDARPPPIAMVHPIAAPPFTVGVHSIAKNTTQLWGIVSSVNSEIAAPLAVPTMNSKFRWNVIGLLQDSVKTELDHFRLWDVSPTQDIGGDGKSMIDLTNEKIDAMPWASRRGTGTVDIGEWYQFNGIRLAASLEHASGNMGHHWSDTPENGTTYRANNFGSRFGMSLNRFQTIDASLVFSRPNTDDPWAPIGDYVQLFNVRRRQCLQSCGHLTFDESGSKWRGKNGHFHIDGLPHVTKCPRKPEPFNLEFKNVCDGDTGIMMVLMCSRINRAFFFVQKRSKMRAHHLIFFIFSQALEIQAGAETMATKRYASQYGHATAVVMRLSEEAGVLGTKRTVYGDSFFASVEICEVLATNGLYFKGIVKQSYSKYPKMFLQEWYWLGSKQHACAAKQISRIRQSKSPSQTRCSARQSERSSSA